MQLLRRLCERPRETFLIFLPSHLVSSSRFTAPRLSWRLEEGREKMKGEMRIAEGVRANRFASDGIFGCSSLKASRLLRTQSAGAPWPLLR